MQNTFSKVTVELKLQRNINTIGSLVPLGRLRRSSLTLGSSEISKNLPVTLQRLHVSLEFFGSLRVVFGKLRKTSGHLKISQLEKTLFRRLIVEEGARSG